MSKQHFTGQKILETYELQELDLFELASEGWLQPIDELGNKLPDPIIEMMDAEINKVAAKIDTVKQSV